MIHSHNITMNKRRHRMRMSRSMPAFQTIEETSSSSINESSSSSSSSSSCDSCSDLDSVDLPIAEQQQQQQQQQHSVPFPLPPLPQLPSPSRRSSSGGRRHRKRHQVHSKSIEIPTATVITDNIIPANIPVSPTKKKQQEYQYHEPIVIAKEWNNNNDYPSLDKNNAFIVSKDQSSPIVRKIKCNRKSFFATLMVFSIVWVFLSCIIMTRFHYLETDPFIMDTILGHDTGNKNNKIRHAVSGVVKANSNIANRLTNNAQPSHSKMSQLIGSMSSPVSQHHHVIPLPLPTQKVSVVIMNYSRPRMIRESSLLRTLLSHPNIDEVLMLHSNPKTAFEFVHPKVINIDATQHNDEMGLSLRFHFCQMAKNDWIIHVDDDMEFPASALNDLLIEYARNTKRIVGKFGRDLVEHNSFNGYNSRNTHKSTEVVLTKLMVMERNMCAQFFNYSSIVWDDMILQSGEGPLWNGEDIFMSLVANHVYGPPTDGRPYNNYAMDWLDVWQASDSLKDYDNGKLDISGGMDGIKFWDWHWWQSILRRNRHYSYRGKLWHTAKDRLLKLDLQALDLEEGDNSGSTEEEANSSQQ